MQQNTKLIENVHLFTKQILICILITSDSDKLSINKSTFHSCTQKFVAVFINFFCLSTIVYLFHSSTKTNKGNNKITELRTILQRESQNSYVYKQTKSVNNRKTENRNDPDLVQAFLKKWWVESDFKVPNLPLSLRLKGSGCYYNSIYNKLQQN